MDYDDYLERQVEDYFWGVEEREEEDDYNEDDHYYQDRLNEED